MPHPRILARAFLLVFVVLALVALPTIYLPAGAAQPGDFASIMSPRGPGFAASGRAREPQATIAHALALGPELTPENAGAHMARLQPAPQQAVLPGDVVISEVRFLGSNGEPDEFIELYNRNCLEPIQLNGWKLKTSDGADGTNDAFFTIPPSPPDLYIQPGGYFLLSPSASLPTIFFDDGILPDATYSPGIPVDGGVRLTLPDDTIVDQVGLSEDTIYREGSALDTLTGSTDRGYRRNTSPSGMYLDSDENAADFTEVNPSRAQNSLGPADPAAACGIPTATPTNTPTATPTDVCSALSIGPLRILINEVAWAGTLDSTGDYWVELYNPHPTCARDLANWRLVGIRTGAQIFEVNFTSDDDIAPLGYMVLTVNDATFNPELENSVEKKVTSALILGSTGQSLQLLGPGDILVDTANYSPTGNLTWPAGSTSQRRSMERYRPSADSRTNWVTFARPLPFPSGWPKARNGSNYIYGSPGMANWALAVTLTPSPVPTKFRTPTPRPPTPFAHMIINEFLPRAGTDWNLDGQVNVYDEFIEIKNNGPIDGDLANWKLDDVADGGSPPFTLPSVILKPGERAVFYGLQTRLLLDDSGDTVRLIDPRNILIDARGYGVIENMDESHCRLPDGYYWQLACFATPGNENALSGVAPAPAPILLSAPPPCLLADTVPEPFVEAECNGFGSEVYDLTYWDEPAPEPPFGVEDPQHKWKITIE